MSTNSLQDLADFSLSLSQNQPDSTLPTNIHASEMPDETSQKDVDPWEPDKPHPIKARAIVRYATAGDAHRACKALHGSKVAEFGNTRLYVNLMTFFKYQIAKSMYEEIKEHVAELANHAWESGQAHLKVYAPELDQTKVTLRIYGENAAQVSKVKFSLEHMLSETTAVKGAATL